MKSRTMKSDTVNNTNFKSILSLGLLGLFLVIAVGSEDEQFLLAMLGIDLEVEEKYFPEKDNYEQSYKWDRFHHVKHMPRQKHGIREGKFNYVSGYFNDETGDTVYADENGVLLEGLRYGPCVTTYHYGKNLEEFWEKTVYYIAGHPVSKSAYESWQNPKKSQPASSANSAWQRLSERYPWFIFQILSCGFDSTYQEHYLDTLELILHTDTFDLEGFDDLYDQAIDELSMTPYDSLIQVNNVFSYLQGMDAVMQNELRLAVIDRYYNQSGSTFDIIESTYPGYIDIMVSEAEVPEADLRLFCEKLDSALNSYGTLDLEDPFFIDSIDSWIYRALFAIMDTGEEPELKSAVEAVDFNCGNHAGINNFLRGAMLEFQAGSEVVTPPEVAEIVLFTIIMTFLEGDLIKESVFHSMLLQNGIASPPEVITSFHSHLSASGVKLIGLVFTEGDAEIIERGIAWASHHNPTTSDETKTSGTGSGFFYSELSNLTEGEHYYARAYATNTAGTTYGNCIEFTAINTVGEPPSFTHKVPLRIYPNPASSFARLTIPTAISGNCRVSITDMAGRVHLDMYIGMSSLKGQEILLDLSGIEDGSYICRLSSESGEDYSGRLVISH